MNLCDGARSSPVAATPPSPVVPAAPSPRAADTAETPRALPAARTPPLRSAAFLFAFAVHGCAASTYFAIQVTDEVTGRGVPMVELETVDHVSFWTDSQGMIALGEADLMGRRIFFHIRSHGYVIPPDGFGSYGRAVEVKAGGRAELKMQRINIAERLYRLTGEGIYRDSRLLGLPAPPEHHGLVAGQDSTMAVRYGEKYFWFGGDTMRLSYPLGHFRSCGATVPVPGLDPDRHIPLTYFTGPDGFSRGMWPLAPGEPRHLLMWPDGFVVAPDEAGRARMLAHYEQHSSLDKVEQHGLGVFNDETEVFDQVSTLDPADTWRHPRGHPATGRGEHAGHFLFRASSKHHAPFPAVRARATLAALRDPAAYEAFTCRLADGTLEHNAEGRAVWKWRRDAAPLTQEEEAALLRTGKLREEDARYRLRDVETGKLLEIHGGSVRWNEYRKKWVLIAGQRGGTSFLGEIWFAEAGDVTGPWRSARKIVTHQRQSFYNPVQHDFLDREGGRFIYFEGTYTNEFSGNPAKTPRYQYNQILYRLDLSDPRLVPAAR